MFTYFDIDKLLALLRDFYEISHIRITVFDRDLNELISYPADVAPYCAVIRETAEGRTACGECDRKSCQEAARRRTTYIYRCHAGFTEAIDPLFAGDVLIGYLLFGHVFSYPSLQEGWQSVRQCCRKIPADPVKLRKAVYRSQPIPEGYVLSAAHILHAVASCLTLERMATLREEPLAARLDAYLSVHFTQRPDSDTIARALGIGRTQLYAVSNSLYGCGTAKRIRTLCIAMAKRLLTERKDLSLTEVASQCGFEEYNYFSAVFTRETGITPHAYRKMN